MAGERRIPIKVADKGKDFYRGDGTCYAPMSALVIPACSYMTLSIEV